VWEVLLHHLAGAQHQQQQALMHGGQLPRHLLLPGALSPPPPNPQGLSLVQQMQLLLLVLQQHQHQ
jgi:hypothetical protein